MYSGGTFKIAADIGVNFKTATDLEITSNY
jgi:hypothetical protein